MEGLQAQVWNILIAQAVVGGLGLIGLIAVVRRFMGTEFPAAMLAVNVRLDTLHRDFEALRAELILLRRDVDKQGVRLDDTRDRVKDLERKP